MRPAPSSAYCVLDIGTSAVKGTLFASGGEVLQRSARQLGFLRSDGVCAEQDAEALIVRALEVFAACREYAESKKTPIASIGIALQRSGVLSWEAGSGRATSALITWKDKRYQAKVESLSEAEKAVVYKHSGLPASAHYAGVKIGQLQKENAKADGMRVGTLDSFLLHRLLDSKQKKFVTCETFAQRTNLYSLKSRTWDSQLCKLFDVDEKQLAQIVPDVSNYGMVQRIPLQCLVGDGQAAFLGAALKEDEASLTLGTVATVAAKIPDKATNAHDGFLTSLVYSKNRSSTDTLPYMLEGTVNCCGEVLQKLYGSSTRSTDFENKLLQEYQTLSPDAAVCFAPNGEFTTPYWQILSTEGSGRYTHVSADLIVFENLLFHLADMLLEFKKRLQNVTGIRVQGGYAKRADLFLVLLGSLTQLHLTRRVEEQGTSRGVLSLLSASPSISGPSEPLATTVPSEIEILVEQRFKSWREKLSAKLLTEK